MRNQLPILFLFVLFFSSCSLIDSSEEQTEFPAEKKKELDQYFESLHQSLPVPGVGVALVKGGQVYYNAHGLLRSDAKAPILDSTSFFTGNISELMVATVVLKMAESGKIALDDPVVKHLPHFMLKQGHQSITIRHLLTQTGGIPVHDVLWDLPDLTDKALEKTTRSIADQIPEITPPGSKVKRSPYNFDILADLIRTVSKTSFEAYAKEAVFKPLQMHSSSFFKPELNFNTLAKPHIIQNWLTYSFQPENLYPYNREHAGSIGLHSSVKDLSKWMHMLLNGGKTAGGRFLADDLHAELLKVQYRTSKNTAIGLGWEIQSVEDQEVFRKSHTIGGFSASLALIPEENIGAIVISNVSSEDFNATSITNNMLWWLKGNKLTSIKKPVNIELGKIYDRTKSIDSSFKAYVDLKQRQPAAYDYGIQALSQLGVNLSFRINKAQEGLKVFEFAAQQFPSSAYAQVSLAEAYMVSKQLDKAKAALSKAKALNAKEKDAEVTERIGFVDSTFKKQEQKAANTAKIFK